MRWVFTLVAIVAVASSSAPADACAVCSTADRTLSTGGAERPFGTSARLAVDARTGTTRIADDSAPYMLRDRRLELATSFALSKSELVGIAVPFMHRDVTAAGGTQSRLFLGDVELRMQVQTLRILRPTRHRAGLLADIGLPTAPLQRDATGAPLPVALQPGCGSIVPAIGGFYTVGQGAWSAFVSAQIVLPMVVRDGPHPGRSVRAALWAQYQPFDSGAIRLGVSQKAEARGELAPGTYDPNSGGLLTFATAQLIASPLTDSFVAVGVHIPVVQSLVGARREGPIVAINFTYEL